MAAVTELFFLLFALVNNIHAEEIIIGKEGASYTFSLPEDATSCLISRFVGEEKLVLWNTSDLRSHSYVINKLNRSDSGTYQEECWTDGKVTHEKNISIIICSVISHRWDLLWARLGGTVDLPCWGAADDLDIQWLKREVRKQKEIWTRVFGDNTTSVQGRHQVVKNTSTLRVSNSTTTDFGLYNCLVMNQQQCFSRQVVSLELYTELIYRSVEETAVLPCTVTHSTDDEPPRWNKDGHYIVEGKENHILPSVDQNHSLVLSSLTLNHSGWYYCDTSMRSQVYELVVCPKFGPPAVELFSEGEHVNLTCTAWKKGRRHFWFISSKRTEGRVFNLDSDQNILSGVSLDDHNGTLVISNVSLKDSGEYWCAVMDSNVYQCLPTTKTLLQYRDPFGVHSTFYKVRCSVLSVLLLVLCVVVVAVNKWTKREEQLSAQ